MTPRRSICLTVLLLCSLGAGSLPAQITTATIVGKVQDSSGAVIPSAEIQAKRGSTNEVFKTIATETGDYSLVRLPVGTYTIEASLTGFKTEVRSGITVEVGRTYRIDFQLAVGQIADRVEITAQAPILRTEAPEFGQVIDNTKINAIPLNSRDVIYSLAALTPGMMPARRSLGNPESFNSGSHFNVRGNRPVDNVVLLDGGILSFGNGQLTFLISPDAVQEFEVKTGLYGAEYGLRPGGQFSVVTKSGTNALHGTFYEFHRNDNLDARNFFDPGARPEFKRNQFGAVMGGPIVVPRLFDGRDKAWFFFSYAGERTRRLLSLTGNVPTADEKAGRFATAITDPLTGQPFANNTIPTSRFSSIAQKFLPFWPDANTTGRGFNYTSPNSSATGDSDQFVAKLDFKTSDSSRWTGRFLYHSAPIPVPNPIATFSYQESYYTVSQSIGNTRSFGTRFVNDFHFNFLRNQELPPLAPARAGFGTEFGVPNFPIRPVDFTGAPRVTVTNLLAVGDNSSAGPYNEVGWEARDGFTFSRGSHAFSGGYHFRRYGILVNLISRSVLDFQPRYTRNAFADFLLGYLTGSTLGDENFRENYGQNTHSFYFQDSWKASSKLTLTAGLRYELRAAGKDKRGLQSNFNHITGQMDPPIASRTLQPWETGRYVADVPTIVWSKAIFLPRLGLAYRVTDKTVVRSGFGFYANEPSVTMIQSLGQNPRPNALAVSYTSDPATPNLTLSNPFNPGSAVPGGALPNARGIQRPLPQQLSYSWGLSIQHELARNTAFEIGYQGSHVVHELMVTSYNDAVPGTAPRQSRRPYPAFQTINMVTANGDVKYNALEMKLERRAGANGLSGLLGYTWAKAFDTVGGRLSTPGDPGAISRNMPVKDNRGLGEANIPNRFTTMLGYDVPFGPGKRYLTDGLAGKLLGGWGFYSLLTAQGGFWFTPIYSTDRLDVGSTASSRPDLVGNPNLSSDQRRPQRWFNTAAFAAPAAFKYGNAGRSIIQGPGYFNIDLSLQRSFKITESSRVEFRFDAFNAINHTNFRVPGNAFGTGSFGVIGSAIEARDLQFGLKIYY